jgi:hypothetical protein
VRRVHVLLSDLLAGLWSASPSLFCSACPVGGGVASNSIMAFASLYASHRIANSRLKRAPAALSESCRNELHAPIKEQHQKLVQKLRGHMIASRSQLPQSDPSSDAKIYKSSPCSTQGNINCKYYGHNSSFP